MVNYDYKGRGEHLRAAHPSRIHRRWSSAMYKVCGASLLGLQLSIIHGKWSIRGAVNP